MTYNGGMREIDARGAKGTVSADDGYDLAISGRMVTPEGERPGSVLVREGRIVALAPPDQPVMARRRIVTGAGWVAPGFIDLQINGALGHDFSGAPDVVQAVARWLPRTGVTAFLPTLITAPIDHLRAALRRIGTNGASTCGARMLGVHLEGPWLNPAYRGAHMVEWLRPINVAELDDVCGSGPVRLVTLAPELEGGLAAIRRLRERGIVVSLGHSGASHEQAVAAITAGARLGTHLFNAMAPPHHRAPGLAGALLLEPDVRAGLIADSVHVHPAMLALAYRLRGPSGLVLVTDAMAALGMADGDYILGGRWARVAAGVARLPDGTLAGSVLSMDEAVRAMRRACGCSLAEAVRMASQTPAETLGLTDHGRLAPGAVADLVVLDEQARVRQTVIDGQVVWDRETDERDV